jgi:phage terminase small subunit
VAALATKYRPHPTPKGIRKWKNGTLSLMQLKAIDEFFQNGGFQAKAMLAAGYAKTTAETCPHHVFSNPLVVAEIERRRRYLIETDEIDEKWVLRRLAKIANAGEILGRFRKVNGDGQPYWDFTGATEAELSVITEMTTETYIEGRGEDGREIKKVKIGLPDSKGALDSLSRVLGLNKDKLTVDGNLGIVEKLQAGRKRLAKPAAK